MSEASGQEPDVSATSLLGMEAMIDTAAPQERYLKVIEQGGVVKKMLKEGQTPEQVMDNLYLRCLSRKPTAEELCKLKEFFHDDAKPEPVLTDVFWSLLNAKEFVFNH